MNADTSRLIFDGNVFDTEKDFVASIPAGLSSQDQLFTALSQALEFPDYFGKNWNALLDCLTDLSWIKHRRVVIKHSDLPPLEPKTLSTYLDILSECVEDWKLSREHELYIVFPEHARDAVLEAIPKNPRPRGRG
jgi:RNAse (barnase) inhibitor barstar